MSDDTKIQAGRAVGTAQALWPADDIARAGRGDGRSGDAHDKTLTDHTYRQLRHDIITGVRRPGEQLKLGYLRSVYGVGLSPLREALQRLSTTGLVEVQGQRGFRVRTLTVEEVWDLAHARILVETRALELSLRDGDDHWEARVNATAYRLEKYDRLLAEDSTDALEQWEEANRDFHSAIVEGCRSPWILRLRSMLFDQHEQYRRASLRHHQQRGGRDVLGEHRSIKEAVLARDLSLAGKLIADHITSLAKGFEAGFGSSEPSTPQSPRRSRLRSASADADPATDETLEVGS